MYQAALILMFTDPPIHKIDQPAVHRVAKHQLAVPQAVNSTKAKQLGPSQEFKLQVRFVRGVRPLPLFCPEMICGLGVNPLPPLQIAHRDGHGNFSLHYRLQTTPGISILT